MSGESGESVAPVLLYDGVCGFCNRSVRTIIRFDAAGPLRFAALQSVFAKAIVERHPEIGNVDSMVFVDDPGQPSERVAVRSEAALRVADYLGGAWRVLTVARILPAPLRDWLYDRFAAIRYRAFGRYDSCPLPSPEVRARFVED
ncbi:thiol-disulfide oxidoreductase DCC family protein [Mycobacterium intracellulare]|uniref:thiol-disulfide oxidoreductase DCC family protein n=1 Tax=Mycobacterium intracellulare TaxID=1767 RepID=UPI001EED3375|nr:DCC1-like thiol-disulfide oxidoreductase family protein [Mycobacterium intracellulare]MEE3753355.1 DCC1-like thiol-disulfide oxidoreductase family protein [Mycobacterium intracellulare]